MAAVSYYTVGGRILGQRDSSGDRTDYVKDHLGSVIVTIDQGGNVLNKYRYLPYGAVAEKTGTAPDPRFLWVGTYGSQTTKVSKVTNYNRYRHYVAGFAGWLRVDQLWPGELAYVYADSNPVSNIDPLGLASIDSKCESCLGRRHYFNLMKALAMFCHAMNQGGSKRDCIMRCASEQGLKLDIKCFQKYCKSNKTIFCDNGLGCELTKKYRCPAKCNCDGRVIDIPGACGVTRKNCKEIALCCKGGQDSLREECGCEPWIDVIVTCVEDATFSSPVTIMFHELAHLCGKNCTKHNVFRGNEHNDFAICAKKCLGIHQW